MARVAPTMSVSEIKAQAFRLTERQFLRLASSIEDRAETLLFMKAGESGFREWNAKGEDIYDARPPAR